MREDATAGVVAPPPLILAACLAVGVTLDRLTDLAFTGADLLRGSAAALLFLGAAGLALAALLTLRRAGTPVEPWHPTTQLVTHGVFSLSRNPIYVAFLLLQLSVGLAFGGPITLLLTAPLLAALHFGVVKREERYLAERFGEPYRAYRQGVRRYV